MEEELKLVDLVFELRDARMPMASANPLLNDLAANKPRLVILNKQDMADANESSKWQNYFGKNGRCILLNSTSADVQKTIVAISKDIMKEKLEKARARGIRKKVLRAMVVGIPNVGKSTLINNVVKKRVARAENRAGVTRNLQWIRINEDLELLDTPGILWPRFDDQNAARILALLGSLNDDVVNKEELLLFALDYLKKYYPGLLHERYGIDENEDDLLVKIAYARKWLLSNERIDKTKTMDLLLKDIRNNNLGRITWEQYVE